MRSCLMQMRAISWRVSTGATAPVGFVGKLSISTLVLGVMAASSTAGLRAKRSCLLVGTAVATP